MKFYIDCSDKRNTYLFKFLAESGRSVADYNKEKGAGAGDVLVFAPNKKFSEQDLQILPEFSTLICGNLPADQQKNLQKKQINHINLMLDEEFAVKNSNLTAEGVLANVLTLSEKSVFKNKILILGNGRVAKSCAILFGKLGLNFEICSFNSENFSSNYFYSERNFKGCDLQKNIEKFDVIINTIPAQIIDQKIAEKIQKNCLFLEAASIKCLEVENLNFNYVLAPALPQKFAAEEAGKVMFESVRKNLKI